MVASKDLLALPFVAILLFFPLAHDAASADGREIEIARQAMQAGNDAEAVAMLKPLAERGDPTAQRFYGNMISDGRVPGIPRKQAVEWYWKAAQQGDLDAMYNHGLAFLHGEIVPADDVEALLSFYDAAEKGHAPSQEALAMMYTEGRAVEKDIERAEVLLAQATSSGYPPAAIELGFRWFKRALERKFWPDLERAYMKLTYGLALNDRAPADDRLEAEIVAATKSAINAIEESVPSEDLRPARQQVELWLADRDAREQDGKQAP